MTESWISPQLLAAMCANHYHQSQVVCPPNLCESLFTIAAFDNIDHNPTSTTAADALHGTRISLFQHPNSYGWHEHREYPTLAQKSTSKKLSDLPQSYTTVCPLMPMKKDTTFPKVDGPMKSDGQVIHQALQEDIRLAAVQKSFISM